VIDAERLLTGLAQTLERTVAPALGPGFARGQLQAVLDVLDNLPGRLVWGGAADEQEVEALATLLAAVASQQGPRDGQGGDLARRLQAWPGLASASLAERLHEGRSLVCALVESGLADHGEVASAVDAYLTGDAVVRAMGLRPTRLAEISQG
jgi:hypothetical protein